MLVAVAIPLTCLYSFGHGNADWASMQCLNDWTGKCQHPRTSPEMSTQIIDRVLTRPTLLRISVGKKLNLSLELNNSMSVPSNVIELNAMKAVSEFLSTEGCIAVATQWNRPDPNAFPDYWGIICCCRWAFEITSLTSLDSDAYRVVGGRASDHGLARLQMPIPQVLDDSGTLRYRLEVSLSRKGVSKKLVTVQT